MLLLKKFLSPVFAGILLLTSFDASPIYAEACPASRPLHRAFEYQALQSREIEYQRAAGLAPRHLSAKTNRLAQEFAYEATDNLASVYTLLHYSIEKGRKSEARVAAQYLRQNYGAGTYKSALASISRDLKMSRLEISRRTSRHPWFYSWVWIGLCTVFIVSFVVISFHHIHPTIFHDIFEFVKHYVFKDTSTGKGVLAAGSYYLGAKKKAQLLQSGDSVGILPGQFVITDVYRTAPVVVAKVPPEDQSLFMVIHDRVNKIALVAHFLKHQVSDQEALSTLMKALFESEFSNFSQVRMTLIEPPLYGRESLMPKVIPHIAEIFKGNSYAAPHFYRETAEEGIIFDARTGLLNPLNDKWVRASQSLQVLVHAMDENNELLDVLGPLRQAQAPAERTLALDEMPIQIHQKRMPLDLDGAIRFALGPCTLTFRLHPLEVRVVVPGLIPMTFKLTAGQEYLFGRSYGRNDIEVPHHEVPEEAGGIVVQKSLISIHDPQRLLRRIHWSA